MCACVGGGGHLKGHVTAAFVVWRTVYFLTLAYVSFLFVSNLQRDNQQVPEPRSSHGDSTFVYVHVWSVVQTTRMWPPKNQTWDY